VSGATGVAGTAGVTGATGLAGATGPKGATGSQGPPGSPEIITCLTLTTTSTSHGHTVFTHPRKCTGVAAGAKSSIKGNGIASRAYLVRGKVLYSSGTGLVEAGNRIQLLMDDSRPVSKGAYTLVLRRIKGNHWVSSTLAITIT
jgi:hypothetical protein